MAGEIADDKFKSDVIRFIEVATLKFDGLSSDLRTNSFRMDRMEAKIDGMETKIGGMETKIDGMETKIDGLGTKLNGLETKIDRVENKVKDLASDVTTLSRQFDAVGVVAIADHKRIDHLEERVDKLDGRIQ